MLGYSDGLKREPIAQNKARPNGCALFCVCHKPTADDITMAKWFNSADCRLVVVANKLDKLKKSEIEPNLALIRETLSLPETVTLIPFSAEKGQGREQLLAEILKEL